MASSKSMNIRNDNQLVEEVLDRLSQIAEVRAQRMFGGHGLFHDGLMFALIADNELYLKADHESEHWFVDAGLEKFRYRKRSGDVRMSYYRAPASLFEDEDEARLWTGRAIDAALRAAQRKKGT